MNNVDRYKIDVEGYMIDSPNGQWVDYEDYAALQQKLDALVGLVEKVDNSHCMCGAEIDKKYGCGCGHTVGMFDYHYGEWSEQYGSGTHDTADKAG